jgi:hypothetical protein
MNIRQSIECLRRLEYGEVEAMARATGLHLNTLLLIRAGKTTDPRLGTAESIHGYLSKTFKKVK